MILKVDPNRFFYLPFEEKTSHFNNKLNVSDSKLSKILQDEYNLNAIFKIIKYTDTMRNSKKYYALKFNLTGVIEINLIIDIHNKIHYDYNDVECLILDLKLNSFKNDNNANAIEMNINFTKK